MPDEKYGEAEPSQNKVSPITLNVPFEPLSHFLSLGKNPAFYANGFQAGLTHSECYLIFMQNNAQKVAITLPLPAIKSLRLTLEKIEADYAKQYGIEILSVEELNTRKKENQ